MKPNISHIIAACDLSDFSSPVIQYASYMSTKFGARLTIVSIINQREIEAVKNLMSLNEMIKDTIYMDQYLDDLKSERNQYIEALVKEPAHDIPDHEIMIRVGIPFEKIIKTVKELNADLLVIGKKGRSNLSEIVLGSTAERLFRYCPATILSVRLPGHIQ